jgi:hypothetical protein
MFADIEPRVKVGDKVVVGSSMGYDITVKSIQTLEDKRVELILDWGQYGKSRVYMHDHGKTWKLKVDIN